MVLVHLDVSCALRFCFCFLLRAFCFLAVSGKGRGVASCVETASFAALACGACSFILCLPFCLSHPFLPFSPRNHPVLALCALVSPADVTALQKLIGQAGATATSLATDLQGSDRLHARAGLCCCRHSAIAHAGLCVCFRVYICLWPVVCGLWFV